MSKITPRKKVKLNVPGYVKDMAMLSPSKNGKIDRQFIRMMCDAIDSANRHKNANLKKFNKDLATDD